MTDGALGELVQSFHGLTPGSDAYRQQIADLLPLVRDLVRGSWADARHSSTDATDPAEMRDKAIRELDWILLIRNELLQPLEETTVAERKEAIGTAMGAGVPASALVKSTGLTLARIYQIRDGRR